MKMTKISRQNLMVADRVVIVPQSIDDSAGYLLQVYRGDMSAFVSSADGPVEYVSIEAASRAVRRVRSDLEPTTI